MRLVPNLYRSFGVILSTTLLLTNNLFGHSQSSAREWGFPNQRNRQLSFSQFQHSFRLDTQTSKSSVSDLLTFLQHESLCILLFNHNVFFGGANCAWSNKIARRDS